MKTFLFEQYGYYPSSFDNNEFELEGYKFKLLQTRFSEEDVLQMQYPIEVLKDSFYRWGPFIIKNKYDKYVSTYENENYILVAIYKINIGNNYIKKMHQTFYKNDECIELNKTLEVWQKRVENIEKNLSSYISVEEPCGKDIINEAMFYIGLSTNAMQYLSDVIGDLGEKLYGVTIAHKRFNNFESFDFLNPMNFIIDTPCRDLCFMIQNELMTMEEFSKTLNEYNLDIKSARVLMAKIMYRCDFFDCLENKKVKSSNFNIEKEMNKIKKAYSLLKNKYQIRPIDWLES